MAISSSDYVYVSPVIKHANYGTTPLRKYQETYVYGRNKESFNEQVEAGRVLIPVGFACAANQYCLPYKTEEMVKQYLGVARARVFQGKYIFLSETFTVLFSRMNSNIYKNIFPEVVSNLSSINEAIGNTPLTLFDVVQANHGLELYDAVYLDSDGKYQKAIAEESEKAMVAGVVTKISSNSVFTLMTTGKFEYPAMSHSDTSILYLSDKNPGKMVHYSEIANTVYVPVAIYAGNSIIIDIQQGSVGGPLSPYVEDSSAFDLYTPEELDAVIEHLRRAVQ